eukprot:2374232-Rhodomonas_salina.1
MGESSSEFESATEASETEHDTQSTGLFSTRHCTQQQARRRELSSSVFALIILLVVTVIALATALQTPWAAHRPIAEQTTRT